MIKHFIDISDFNKSELKKINNFAKKIKNRPIRLENIVELKKIFPNIFMINQNYVADEGYIKSLEND